MTRLAPLTVAFALLMSLTGCGTSAPDAQMLSVRTVGAAHSSLGTAKMASSKGNAPVGALKISFASLGHARSLMALSDINAVKVVLTAADGTTQNRLLERAALATASPSVQFEAVPVGPAGLSVSALDAQGTVIGQSSANAQVVARQTAQVGLTVHLAGTAAPEPTTGNLAVSVSFVEDKPFQSATPAPTPLPTRTPEPVNNTPAATPTPAPATQNPQPGGDAKAGEIRGRVFSADNKQQLTGTVRFLSRDEKQPYDVTVGLKADGYYYMTGVPLGVEISVTAASGWMMSQTSHTFDGAGKLFDVQMQ